MIKIMKRKTFEEILKSKNFSLISDEIIKLTKEAENYKNIMRHAKSQLQYSMHECFLQITQTKLSKLEKTLEA